MDQQFGLLNVYLTLIPGGRTFFLVDTSSLMKLAQMYEFIAEGPQEKKQ